MLASSKGNQIRLWEWDGTRWQKLNPLKGHTGSITRVAFSPDCRTLASAGLDGKIRLWDISHPQSNNSVALTEHAEGVTWLSFSPDGQSLASSSYDRSIKIWQRAN
jgi:WD40 repeat protein